MSAADDRPGGIAPTGARDERAPVGRAGEGGARERLFIAIDVGDAIRAEVARVVAAISAKIEAAKIPPKVVWVKPNALHVTLRFLGEVGDEEAARVRHVLAPPILLPPFEIEWRGVGAFPSPRHPRALWLGVIRGAAELGAVEAEVSRRLGGLSTPAIEGSRVAGDGGHQARPFLPHLTLGRIKMVGQGVDWARILQGVEVRGVRSRADRVTLYRSELSHRGPHYTGLVSAPLLANDT